jgi:hypothetical protein
MLGYIANPNVCCTVLHFYRTAASELDDPQGYVEVARPVVHLQLQPVQLPLVLLRVEGGPHYAKQPLVLSPVLCQLPVDPHKVLQTAGRVRALGSQG